MKCPSCLAPVNFSRKDCPRCGAVYQEAFESKAWAEHHRKKTARTAHPARRHKAGGRSSAWAAGAGAAAILVIGWAVLAPPPGLPLPAGARRIESHGFALAAPAGWSADFTESPRQELVCAARLSQGPVAVEVLVGERSLYDRARTAEGARRLAETQFNGGEARLESVAEEEIDRLPALRLKVSGGRVYLPSPSAGRLASPLHAPAPRYESLEFSGELVAVRGAGRSYLIKISSDRDSLSRQSRSVEALLNSFRVTRRPLTLAHLRQALTGAGP
ncbi:MAG: hypothetical protein HY077_11660 [Elusimicrobia bacterium]|nr:hypothetical protein [Elusimicrobiota bacterium]